MKHADLKFRNQDIVYTGKFRKYMDEYFRQFLAEDLEFVNEPKNADLKETAIQELKDEAMYIECFCKWLDEEKGISPKEAKKK